MSTAEWRWSRMQIITPNPQQLLLCLDIEKNYGFAADDWQEQGFFLPGATAELYQKLGSEGYAKCIVDDAGNIVSFILALLPDHPLTHNLLSNSSSTIITDTSTTIDFTRAIWIAKIATHKNYHRMGYAQKLYSHLFQQHPNCSFFTATALSPQRNIISEQLQKHMKFTPCGVFLGKKTEEISHPISLIWHRQ